MTKKRKEKKKHTHTQLIKQEVERTLQKGGSPKCVHNEWSFYINLWPLKFTESYSPIRAVIPQKHLSFQ